MVDPGGFHSGWCPGLIGSVAALHSRYYARHWDFGVYFETKVAREMAEFFDRYDSERDLTLSLFDGPDLSGTITIDAGEPDFAERGAHLRWFITADSTRGSGLGRRLMAAAMDHVDARNYAQVYLTTFAGLEAARHLYESFGFDLVRENTAETWGREVSEQLFVRTAR